MPPSPIASRAQGAPRGPKRELRGYDGGKKAKGRKRHLLVDTEGFIRRVVVHAAGVQDRDGGQRVLAGIGAVFPRPRYLWVHAGYRGHGAGSAERALHRSVEVAQH